MGFAGEAKRVPVVRKRKTSDKKTVIPLTPLLLFLIFLPPY